MKKKFIAGLLVLSLTGCLTACGNAETLFREPEEVTEDAGETKAEDEAGKTESEEEETPAEEQEAEKEQEPSEEEKPEETPGKDAEEAKEDSVPEAVWAKAYLDYLDDFEEEALRQGEDCYDTPEKRGYNLIYVNEDEIPELLMEGADEATGNLILTFDGNKIDELQTARLYFDFLEKKNQLRNADGHMGGYYDLLYAIRDGKWEMTDHGEYYVEDNTVMWEDEDLQYEWNGKSVSAEEYQHELEKCYDLSHAVSTTGVLSYEEIRSKLKEKGADADSAT